MCRLAYHKDWGLVGASTPVFDRSVLSAVNLVQLYVDLAWSAQSKPRALLNYKSVSRMLIEIVGLLQADSFGPIFKSK